MDACGGLVDSDVERVSDLKLKLKLKLKRESCL